MPSLDILDLNLQYEFERAARTDNTALNELMLARNGLMKEIIETFGEDMGDVKLDRKYVTRFDYEKDPTKPTQLPEKNNDDLILGILRFANAIGLDNFGGDGKWAKAVIEMAGWYVKNVHAYSQPTLTFCPLVNRNVRWDCSGFTTACLWLYGALQDVMWPPTSSSYTNDPQIAKKLMDAGFEKYTFSWDIAKPFDIITFPGHVEIYNGIKDGKHSSWAWGSCHDDAHGGLPCSTAHQKQGYDVIWRNKYNGDNTEFMLYEPGESGLSDAMFKYIYQIESGIAYGKSLPISLLKGKDIGDAGGHKTYGAGLLFHPSGKYMDSIKKEWTQAELDALFIQTVKTNVNKVKSWAASKGKSLNQNNIDAIVSGIYNFGPGFLNKNVCKLIANNPNDPRIHDVWAHMSDAQGARYPGLIKRRKLEADWYVGKA